MITIQLPKPRPLNQLSSQSQPILRKKSKKKPRKRKKAKPKQIRNERCLFEQTPIGYIIQHECPIEWQFIMDVRQTRGMSVNADFLENFAYTSDNPVFRTERFRRALMDFREYGYSTPNKMEFDIDRELRYIKNHLNRISGLEF